jgi:hypothetical protein
VSESAASRPHVPFSTAPIPFLLPEGTICFHSATGFRATLVSWRWISPRWVPARKCWDVAIER